MANFSKLDLEILNNAKGQGIVYPPKSEVEKENFLKFVKCFALDVIHDSEVQKELLKPTIEE